MGCHDCPEKHRCPQYKLGRRANYEDELHERAYRDARNSAPNNAYENAHDGGMYETADDRRDRRRRFED